MSSASECGVHPGEDAEKLVEQFKYICDGILVSVVGCIGLIGNITSLFVLSSPRLRDCFHNLLFALACFDTIYIIFGGINYSMMGFEQHNTRIYALTFPYLIHPFLNIGLSGTIFMTVAISIERFLGVCYPLHLPPHKRKSWFYILPVVILSICINIPKFLEARITWLDDESHIQELMDEYMNDTAVNFLPAQWTPSIRPTALRTSSQYIKYYIVYFRLFFLAVLPLLIMIVLNLRIAVDIKSAKVLPPYEVQRFGSKRKMNKEVNFCLVLLCIVVTFMCCHSPRTFVDIWEFSNIESIVNCNEIKSKYLPKKWLLCLLKVSHFCGVLNSSLNFLIYCFVGRNFRQEFFKLIKLRQRPQSIQTHSLMERRQGDTLQLTDKIESEKRQVL